MQVPQDGWMVATGYWRCLGSRQGQKGRSKGITHGSLSHCLTLCLSPSAFPWQQAQLMMTLIESSTHLCVYVFSFTMVMFSLLRYWGCVLIIICSKLANQIETGNFCQLSVSQSNPNKCTSLKHNKRFF